ncbi:electron transfer flavoprotein subunit beta [Sediminicurvatus halobius]|uniref:Electron transfer flavoprotein subunit beta n=1 Tax=Sediminicurvatus halobius TaxID=2182432 RepID=A0A2U2N5X2_9GAMM|nr:electron transfer flavoprotein subunit beta [Spiribacter halobius]PWG64625.1 electron transfer flavoprotein subunit beta [Spiribacter halobius]UEX79052.1 hypothetical protein LMH63_05260 [Spiribacter halobius]
MTAPVIVLLAAGRHPVSGRPRRAPTDARALELALSLPGAPPVLAVHAGDPLEPALREYLGMGLVELTVLDCDPAGDCLPPLQAWLREQAPGLVLTGTASEQGLASGELPYRLAAGLQAAVVGGVTGLEPDGGRWRITQARAGGRRQRLAAAEPLVAAVDPGAPAPRPVAFARARRGRIVTEAPPVPAAEPPAVTLQPARRGARRQRVLRGVSAAERLRAISGGGGSGGRVVQARDPDAAAAEILDQLQRWGVALPQRGAE